MWVNFWKYWNSDSDKVRTNASWQCWYSSPFFYTVGFLFKFKKKNQEGYVLGFNLEQALLGLGFFVQWPIREAKLI